MRLTAITRCNSLALLIGSVASAQKPAPAYYITLVKVSFCLTKYGTGADNASRCTPSITTARGFCSAGLSARALLIIGFFPGVASMTADSLTGRNEDSLGKYRSLNHRPGRCKSRVLGGHGKHDHHRCCADRQRRSRVRTDERHCHESSVCGGGIRPQEEGNVGGADRIDGGG